MSPRWTADQLDPQAYVSPGLDLPVFYGDLDPNGHINNVAFGRFFEMHRVTAHRELGLSQLLHDLGGNIFVARVTINYVQEAHFGHPLSLRLRVTDIGTSSITETQAAWQGGELVALAEVVIVWVHAGRSAPLPDSVRELFESLRR